MAVHPSPRLAALLLLSHLIAVWAAYACNVSAPLAVGMSLLVAVSLVYHLARDAWLLLPASWHRLSVEDRVATVSVRDGSVLVGRILDGSVVTPHFAILRVKPDGKHRPVARVIFPDALGGEGFRELCVRLRYD
ncbi:MAG TPA: protein YgfX [Gallionella sp.]|nr:protein YgfX [Gallionella sp.]